MSPFYYLLTYFNQAKEVVKAMGIPRLSVADWLWVEELLSGTLVFYQMAQQTRGGIQRLLHSTMVRPTLDEALLYGKIRSAIYRQTAQDLRSLDAAMHLAYLIGSVVITFLATFVSSVLSSESSALVDDFDANDTSNPLFWALAILPVLLSLTMTVRNDLNQSSSAVSLDYAAALIDKEIWLYATKTSSYSDIAMRRAIRTGHDVTSRRAAMLTTTLVKITDTHVGLVLNGRKVRRLNVGRFLSKHLRRCRTFYRQKRGVKASSVVSAYSEKSDLEWQKKFGLDTETESGITIEAAKAQPVGAQTGEEYVSRRLAPQRTLWAARTDRLARVNMALKLTMHLLGATGSVLVLTDLSEWVAFTTAVCSAALAFYGGGAFGQQLHRSRHVARQLGNLHVQWKAVPTERRMVQQTADKLVELTETTILDGIEKPQYVDSTTKEAADETAALDKFDRDHLAEREGRSKSAEFVGGLATPGLDELVPLVRMAKKIELKRTIVQQHLGGATGSAYRQLLAELQQRESLTPSESLSILADINLENPSTRSIKKEADEATATTDPTAAPVSTAAPIAAPASTAAPSVAPTAAPSQRRE